MGELDIYISIAKSWSSTADQMVVTADEEQQIARVMAKQYRSAVGPWTAYLSVFER
jgi:hypothetical protein